jgi:phosphoribosylamine--glycine ligase
MNILVVGGGGREHAVVRKLSESKLVKKIYCAPGNAGIEEYAQTFPVKATDIDGTVKLAKDLAVDYVFVTPDDPLVLGMVDALENAGIKTFGPNKAAAVIEGSKSFSKELMKKYAIPTAEYETFTDSEKAIQYVKELGRFPAVIKADGLALGKGVIIAKDLSEAADAIRYMLDGQAFGKSSAKIVIEEFLEGPEVTVLCFTDGKTVKPMISSMDHKPVYDGNKGPNTGGMGTVAPNPYYTQAIADKCMEKIFKPTVTAMNSENRPFKGCLYFGLMITQGDCPKVIEYNCRFGDPETQVVLPLLKTDLAEIIQAVYEQRLDELEIEWKSGSAVCVVMASGGYPKSYETGKEIYGVHKEFPDVTVYHAGTRSETPGLHGSRILTAGGRVLGITGIGESLQIAIEKAYAAAEQISFYGVHYRKDIGLLSYPR